VQSTLVHLSQQLLERGHVGYSFCCAIAIVEGVFRRYESRK